MEKSLEEIENIRQKEIEGEDKGLLSKIKLAKKNRADLENEYKNHLDKIIQKSQGKFKVFLKTHKSSIFEKEIPEKEEKKPSIFDHDFVVERFSFEPTFREKFAVRRELFWFNFKIKFWNFVHFVFPRFVIILFFKIKLKFKYNYKKFKLFVGDSWDDFKEKFFSSLMGIKEFLVKTYSFTRKILFLVLKKDAKPEEKGENNDETKKDGEKTDESLASSE